LEASKCEVEVFPVRGVPVMRITRLVNVALFLFVVWCWLLDKVFGVALCVL
jgi:hypothetical protein